MLPPASLDAGGPGGSSTAAADSPASADLVKKILCLQDELSDLSYQVEAARLSNTTLKQENESLQQEIDKIKQQIAAGAAAAQQQQKQQQQQQQQQQHPVASSGVSTPTEQPSLGGAPTGGPFAVGEKPSDPRATAAPAASSETPAVTEGPPRAESPSGAPERAGAPLSEAAV